MNERQSIRTVALFKQRHEVHALSRVPELTEGVTVAFFPNQTPDQKEAAALTFGHHVELLNDPEIDSTKWYQEAKDALDTGGAVAEITIEEFPGEVEPTTKFWKGYRQALQEGTNS